MADTRLVDLPDIAAVVAAAVLYAVDPTDTMDDPAGSDRKVTLTRLKAWFDAYYAAIGHAHTFASLTSKPTDFAGYGVAGPQTLGADLTIGGDSFNTGAFALNFQSEYRTVQFLFSAAAGPAFTLLIDSETTFFTGTVTATSFAGGGAGLTGLSASNLGSGTVPIARIPTGTTGTTVALGNHDHTGVYQPLDADLTALAALSGTDTIYYRSGASTWSAVTIGSGLTFVSGTLATTGGGGGTPTAIAVANEATDTTCFVGFFTAATGDLGPKSNAGLTFNSATGTLAAMAFSGPLTGNVTGTASTATALATGRTIAITGDLSYTSGSFDGTGNVTGTGTLTSVITAAGPVGGASTIPVITYDAKGRLTAVTTAAVVAPAGTLTGTTLASNVIATSITSTGTLTGGATGAGFTLALTTSTVTGTLPAANMPALTGDVTTSAGAVATTIANDAVTNAKLSNMAAATIKGRQAGGGTGDPEDLTPLQARTAIAANDLDAPFAVVGELSAGTYRLEVDAPFGYTITGLRKLKEASGTGTISIRINGTDVTGLATLAPTTTPTDVSASEANTVAAGNTVDLVVAGGTIIDLQFSLRGART